MVGDWRDYLVRQFVITLAVLGLDREIRRLDENPDADVLLLLGLYDEAADAARQRLTSRRALRLTWTAILRKPCNSRRRPSRMVFSCLHTRTTCPDCTQNRNLPRCFRCTRHAGSTNVSNSLPSSATTILTPPCGNRAKRPVLKSLREPLTSGANRGSFPERTCSAVMRRPCNPR